MQLFNLSTLALALLLIAVFAFFVTAGTMLGRWLRDRPGGHQESAGVVQGALLGLVGLMLAFGLSMAVGRYDNRRALVVQESNDIGTTYLRAQLLAEPERTTSMDLLQQYTDAAIELANQVPDTPSFQTAVEKVEGLQGRLWSVASDAVKLDPVGSAPKLYIEVLNDTFDTHTDRVASLRNRVPPAVMELMILCTALAVGALSMHLALLGRSLTMSVVTAAVLLVILFVSFDLDRPRRGFITVPTTPLVDVRASMDSP